MGGGPMTTLLPYRPERDVYRLLGVAPNASRDEILVACRRLARTFHPDRNSSPRATEEMRVVNAVRRLMDDPSARAEYDVARRRWYTAALQPPPAALAWEPFPSDRGRSTPVRYAVAALVGVRAALVALAPPRCARCRMVIGRDDAYCVACGRPLLTGG
jgi:curved DNA-binding protein CbpA